VELFNFLYQNNQSNTSIYSKEQTEDFEYRNWKKLKLDLDKYIDEINSKMKALIRLLYSKSGDIKEIDDI
jgi:hypothetical protein